ncbi:M10 family metallopeptidase C-terminal domain-containing protein [Neogemmobacter tilapiae]|uniref:Hemolysin n=1 Tax=Neogemmobacter tilapiae TaxID=875041 RepID=A0A918TFR3_9RHOB|nr:calcium-binding protein [Gemmobacter tilapiae]GHC46359.1 hemolysin [Gemmobacter tilapiae]
MTRTLRLTAGNDQFTQGLSPSNVEIRIFALAGNDEIHLNRSDDFGGGNFVDAGTGKDFVQSFAENGSLIKLGDGNDTYVGRGFGSFSTEIGDRVLGGGGNDTFAFETFKSTYEGGAGNDIFHSVGWQNFISGGAGNDTVSYAPRIDDSAQGNSAVTINLTTQQVQTGGARIESLSSIENAIGSGRGDILIGSAGANRLTGAGGLDALEGGAGADHFVYVKASDATIGNVAEQIVDFSRAQGDKIDLAQMDAKAGVSGNQAFAFIGTAAFNGTKGQLRFETNATNQMLVQGDIDGDGNADFQFLVDGVSAMQRGDFVL